MRKELSKTYTRLKNGGIKVRARTPGGKTISYEIKAGDLVLDIAFTDNLGLSRTGRVFLRPVVAKITRVDTILDDLQLLFLAASTCYSSLSASDLIKKARRVDKDKASGLIEELIRAEHLSVVEHRGPSFLVDGFSRAASLSW